MSEIKALEKLRVSEDAAEYQWIRSDYLNQIADEIEAEIADKQKAIRKRCKAECVHWENEMHKVLDTLNGSERFWGACMEYPLDEHTIPPSEIAKKILSDRYMLLPVDANGVPIHVGDICTKLDERFEVRQLRTDGDAWWTIDRLGESYMANFCHHVKSRTLEDVLRDFAKEVNVSSSDFISIDGEEAYMLAAINETADEIRELFGGDAR